MILEDVKKSIIFKVIKIAFSIYVCLTVTLTGMHMAAEYKQYEHAISTELKRFENMFRPVLEEAMWTLEEKVITQTLLGMIQSQIIVGASIENIGKYQNSRKQGVLAGEGVNSKNNFIGDPELLSQDPKFQKALNSRLIPHAFHLHYIGIKGEKQRIGDVVIYSSHSVVIDGVKLGFLFIIMNAFIKTAFLWYIFLWSGFKYLSRPLNAFSKQVANVNLENLESIHYVHKNLMGETELHHLENAFNTMTSQLKNSLKIKNEIENKLQISEKYLLELINSMPSIILGVNSEYLITQWNKSAEHLFQISAKEALGNQATDLLPKFLHSKELINKCISEKKVHILEKTRVLLEDEKFFNMVLYPILVNQQQFVIIRMDDVTEKVRFEDAVIQTEKMNSLGTLAAGMAHELGNPLNTIQNELTQVLSKLDTQVVRNHEVALEYEIELKKILYYLEARGVNTSLHRMQVAQKKALEIIKTVLKFSQRSQTIMRTVYLDGVLNSMLSLLSTDFELQRQINLLGIEINSKISEGLPPIVCNPFEIEQVMLNLVKNSVNALSEQSNVSHPIVNINIKREHQKIIIEVSDNGPGVDETIRDKIFEPFVSTKVLGMGVGLGLAVAKYIVVEKHHGQLFLKSKEEAPLPGACFVVELPISQGLDL
ncbi:MAG: two-component system sensor histidine kinase NtrB [Gammaproteobacteria bacterium]